ncbi:Tat binding protein 1-interacting protein-domain-containing protein [Tuber borchii]|uniref:Tat binding protein 1-interacting protein-domain-containing protein n=1 Tax=Tuber borchii TaxID=42251 RepID=A0A2T6ZHE1_TUBBO|nr:Tat binding protein 1-interacting protein-domain-containing protein [Tuber borchii]
MPPKKEKKEQVTGDQASSLVLEYLRQQNRPYSAIEISANLHNAVTKPTATKILKELDERGEIEGRASGKQVVYHIIQVRPLVPNLEITDDLIIIGLKDPKDLASPEELKVMDMETEAVKQEIGGLKAELRALHSTLNTLKAAPTTASLRETVALLEAEIQNFQVQLEPLRSSAVKPVPVEEKAAISNEHTRLQKILKGRKNQFKEFWDTICDGCIDVNPSDLWAGSDLA